MTILSNFDKESRFPNVLDTKTFVLCASLDDPVDRLECMRPRNQKLGINFFLSKVNKVEISNGVKLLWHFKVKEVFLEMNLISIHEDDICV